jgi:hypothetical protein
VSEVQLHAIDLNGHTEQNIGTAARECWPEVWRGTAIAETAPSLSHRSTERYFDAQEE